MVNDRVPERLLDFVSRPVAAITVTCRDQMVEICGCARLSGNAVVVHEKQDGGAGKDVRTWHIEPHSGYFQALQVAI
jgi:hypothetical protein